MPLDSIDETLINFLIFVKQVLDPRYTLRRNSQVRLNIWVILNPRTNASRIPFLKSPNGLDLIVTLVLET